MKPQMWWMLDVDDRSPYLQDGIDVIKHCVKGKPNAKGCSQYLISKVRKEGNGEKRSTACTYTNTSVDNIRGKHDHRMDMRRMKWK